MPDSRDSNEPGVRVTLRQIHSKVEETSDSVIEIKQQLTGWASHAERLAKIERAVSAHAVIITILIGVMGAGLAKVFV